MSDFINNINFNKRVTIKEPKEKKAPIISRKLSRVYRRIMQLIFFIVTLFILGYGGYKGLLYTVSFIKGYPIESWEQLKNNWDHRYD